MASKLMLFFCFLWSQVCQRACVLWAVSQHFRLQNEHLPDTDDLRVGGDACTNHHPVHTEPLPQDLPASFPGCGWHSVPFDHFYPQWYGQPPCLLFPVFLVCQKLLVHSFFTSTLDLSIIRTVLAMTGKFGITASLSIIYVYSAEVFPTVIR